VQRGKKKTDLTTTNRRGEKKFLTGEKKKRSRKGNSGRGGCFPCRSRRTVRNGRRQSPPPVLRKGGREKSKNFWARREEEGSGERKFLNKKPGDRGSSDCLQTSRAVGRQRGGGKFVKRSDRANEESKRRKWLPGRKIPFQSFSIGEELIRSDKKKKLVMGPLE